MSGNWKERRGRQGGGSWVAGFLRGVLFACLVAGGLVLGLVALLPSPDGVPVAGGGGAGGDAGAGAGREEFARSGPGGVDALESAALAPDRPASAPTAAPRVASPGEGASAALAPPMPDDGQTGGSGLGGMALPAPSAPMAPGSRPLGGLAPGGLSAPDAPGGSGMPSPAPIADGGSGGGIGMVSRSVPSASLPVPDGPGPAAAAPGGFGDGGPGIDALALPPVPTNPDEAREQLAALLAEEAQADEGLAAAGTPEAVGGSEGGAGSGDTATAAVAPEAGGPDPAGVATGTAGEVPAEIALLPDATVPDATLPDAIAPTAPPEIGTQPGSDPGAAPGEDTDLIEGTPGQGMRLPTPRPAGGAAASAPAPERLALAGPALEINAVAFQPRGDVPPVAVVLLDVTAPQAVSPELYAQVPVPLTLGILAGDPRDGEVAGIVAGAGHELIAELPLDAVGGRVPGGVVLSGDLEPAEAEMRAEGLLLRVPGAVAVATVSATLQPGGEDALLDKLSAHGFAYFENRGLGGGAAVRAAERAGVPAVAPDRSASATATEAQIYQSIQMAAGVAQRRGSAVVVVPASQAALQAVIRWSLQENGKKAQIAPLSAVIRARAKG